MYSCNLRGSSMFVRCLIVRTDSECSTETICLRQKSYEQRQSGSNPKKESVWIYVDWPLKHSQCLSWRWALWFEDISWDITWRGGLGNQYEICLESWEEHEASISGFYFKDDDISRLNKSDSIFKPSQYLLTEHDLCASALRIWIMYIQYF